MRWIELIRVQTCKSTLHAKEPGLEKQIQEIATANATAEVFFLQHAVYGTDLAVVIVWRNDAKPAKTREGALIAESMHGLGLVEHAVWQPMIE